MADNNKKKSTEEVVIDFLKKFKDGNIPDEKVHELADKLGMSPHKLESTFYKLAAKYANEMSGTGDKIKGGKGDNSSREDVDADELHVGIAVEMEHTDSEDLALEIALDHLTENPKYYSKLIASGIVDEKEALDIAKELGWLKESKEYRLRKLIREEILTENNTEILYKNYRGMNDTEFLSIVWKMTQEDLQKLLINATDDLKFYTKNSRGILGPLNRRDAQIIKNRIRYIKQIIAAKKRSGPNYIPDFYK